MNASDLTFGIEIECLISDYDYRRHDIQANWSNPVQFRGLPEGWVVKTDSSLRTEVAYTAIEIVSPVLQGHEGVQQVRRVLRYLNSIDVKINHSCGFHVHVGIPCRRDVSKLQKLLSLVAQHERGLYASTGSKRRENSRWSQPINTDYRVAAKTGVYSSVAALAHNAERYRSLNLTNLAGNSKPTAEFRLFAPTLNITKILGHITTCLGLVVHAYTTKGTPSYKRSQPKTTGVEALDRLVRVLGYSAKNGGKGLYGLAITPTEIRAIKKEFKRLAKKYDDHNMTSQLRD